MRDPKFFSPLYPSLQRHTGRSSPVLLSVPGLPFGEKTQFYTNYLLLDAEFQLCRQGKLTHSKRWRHKDLVCRGPLGWMADRKQMDRPELDKSNQSNKLKIVKESSSQCDPLGRSRLPCSGLLCKSLLCHRAGGLCVVYQMRWKNGSCKI